MNPHARFYLDVKDDAGKVTNWEFELGSPNGLMRQGWTRNSLKIGEVVEVNGSQRQGRLQPGQRQQRFVRGRQAGFGRRILGRRSQHEVVSFKFLNGSPVQQACIGFSFFGDKILRAEERSRAGLRPIRRYG